ncbi:hypothetical protein A3A76_02265 [Candidatus Woesebacteria bacterium RIFCSPLOWO2_01_FULL_39_23]|uniref:DUF304 domain-containing protein n=1 Tax=Candidatus Woesebacteria bacterium RIFCSPHIGHO2_01_FULL_40_22 TaxID=1802499 RepID=A0A1F7YI87_9BACT|nr:MAG: hypothetical protein A2141_03420 [Candidatus Woesebacteria bacterium RBG_16_40_11]OGM26225.1 MAG: hypothetical protein A2628_02700 [Candidatus Woesebacteria bacterium RIFCSPHIGHO2_01_FULL_40_22]OGM62383.1 MAG: hypothetical protein A3A76_02265 [Candidatus Woesebacteria bacterium RIFCSPLOWO2_01_FULL_39_23]
MPDLFVSGEKNVNAQVIDEQIKPEVSVHPPVKHPHVKLGNRPSSLKEVETMKSIDHQVKIPEESQGGPISAFNYYPKNVNFINKDPEEKVILFLRRHPVTNLSWVVLTFVLIIAPSFLTVMPFFDALPLKAGTLLILIWYLMTLTYAFQKFLDWFFSVNIVTDERIFDVDFYNLVYRKMTDANIDQIQDVTVQIGGGIRTIFNYGDVLIQTAAEIPEIEFESVPQPDKVSKILRELRVQEEQEKLEGRVR